MKSHRLLAALAFAFGPCAGAQPASDTTAEPPPASMSSFEAVQPPSRFEDDRAVIPQPPVRLRLDPNFSLSARWPEPAAPPAEPAEPFEEPELPPPPELPPAPEDERRKK